MKRFVVFVFLFLFVGFVVYGVLNAPGHLKEVEIIVVEKHGNWKEQISQYVVSLIQPGESISSALIEKLSDKLDSLPWVSRKEILIKGNKLTIKVWETIPTFYLFFNRNYYLIGDNDFVLEKSSRAIRSLPVYYYKGAESPFVTDRGFLKIRKTVKMEIKLANNRIKELTLKGEPPQIILSDNFITLIFRKGRIIVYLGTETTSWDNYKKFVSLAGFLKPGIYDFRFYDMLTRGRK